VQSEVVPTVRSVVRLSDLIIPAIPVHAVVETRCSLSLFLLFVKLQLPVVAEIGIHSFFHLVVADTDNPL
jgi:hypothetical protein